MMTPKAAVWASLLLPGSAHVLCGRWQRGAVAFLTTVLLFVLGASMLGTRIWFFEFSAGSGFIPLGLSLLPESFNIGSTVVAQLFRGPYDVDFQRLVRAPVEREHLWLFLTGASGILSCLWAADAHFCARRIPIPRGSTAPGTAALVSWLVPGAGHVLCGQKDKGILIGTCVVVVFLGGLLLSQGHAVDRPLLSAWWIGDVLFGGGTLLASLVTAPLQYDAVPAQHDLGFALATVAGLMNLVVMIDAYTVAEDKALFHLGQDPAPVGVSA